MKKIINFSTLILFIYLIILCFNSNRYTDYNWFLTCFKAPYLEMIYELNQFMDFRIAYIITFIFGIIVIYPALRDYTKQLLNLFVLRNKLAEIKKRPAKTDEEAYQKTVEMVNTMKESGFSFFNFLSMIFLCFLGSFFLSSMISAVNLDIYNVKSYQILWLDLRYHDKYYIIQSLFIVCAFVYPFINFILNSKNTMDKILKKEMFFTLLITFASAILFLPTVFNSVIFAIFILYIYAKPAILKIKERVLNGIFSKTN